MTYTRVWDETAPPDTQQASLLGKDLRDLKTDIHERLVLSGILANRPTPEAVFVGMIYISTDSAQIFRFDGANWADITTIFLSVGSPLVLFKSGVRVSHTGTVTEDAIWTIPVPALAADSFIRIHAAIKIIIQGAGSSNLIAKLGGTYVVASGFQTSGYNNQQIEMTAWISNRGSTNSQVTDCTFYINPNMSTGFIVGGISNPTAIDTSIPQNLVIGIQSSAASDSQQFEQVLVELL